MKLSEFDYDLPKELIAHYPQKARDEARLMVIDRAKHTLTHRTFKDITEYLREGDVLVLNDTKVLPCRLKGFRHTGGKVEILLLERTHDLTFNALLKPGRLKIHEQVQFEENGIVATITAKNEVTFQAKSIEEVYQRGRLPLPPYIKREPEDLDSEYYQTVYAVHGGSVAAPTAGLHFTQELLTRIRDQGVGIAFLTLHVGHATFRPVKTEEIARHAMGKEFFRINEAAQELIDNARAQKKRIIAVGTTSCRVLETYAQGQTQGYTDLFIYPGYRFFLTDCLLTNFHLPRTTLLMLVSAFAGNALCHHAYQNAIAERYRFYSYGDAMLVL